MPLIDPFHLASVARELREQIGATDGDISTKKLIAECFPDVLVQGEKLDLRIMEIAEVSEHGRVIYYNRNHGTPDHRVAIIHGLAHLIFDFVDPQRLECEPAFKTGPSCDVRERRADLFARDVLVPLHELDERFRGQLFPQEPVERRLFDDECDHVASTFRVPTPFLLFCLYDLAKFRSSNYYVRK